MKPLYRYFYLILVIYFGSGLSFPSAVVVATESVEPTFLVHEVDLGVGRKYKLGKWTWCRIVVESSIDQVAELQITLPDSDGLATVYSSGKIQFVAEKRVLVPFLVQIGKPIGELVVTVKGEDNIQGKEGAYKKKNNGIGYSLESLAKSAGATERLFLNLGEDLGLEKLNIDRRVFETPVHVVKGLTQDEYPTYWEAYQGFDVVFLPTGNWERLEKMTDQQWKALLEWVHRGGRLVCSVGKNGENVNQNSLLKEIVPGDLERTLEQQEWAAVEDLVNARQKIKKIRIRGNQLEVEAIPMAFIANTTGNVLLENVYGIEKQPFIVHKIVGFGEVLFVTFDLDLAPFTHWQDRNRLVKALLRLPMDRIDSVKGQVGGAGLGLGFQDLSGQLQNSLEQYEGISPVSFSVVVLIIAACLAVVGPLDYWFLNKVLAKSPLTWVTLPVVVLICYFVAQQYSVDLRGESLRMNQIEILDFDYEKGEMRSYDQFHLYSPEVEQYKLDLVKNPKVKSVSPHQDMPEERALFNWYGSSGSGLGGMESRVQSFAADDQHYLHRNGSSNFLFAENRPNGPVKVENTSSSLGELWNVPILLGGSKTFASSFWQNGYPKGEGTVFYLDKVGYLTGEFVYPYEFEMTDCYLVYDDWVYPVNKGQLQQGDKLRFDFRNDRNRLKGRITQIRQENSKIISSTWDPYSKDIYRILEIMMFYSSAGGWDYANLHHEYQSDLELSRIQKSGKAILIGRKKEPLLSLEVTGEIAAAGKKVNRKTWTVCRIHIPVKLEK
ncbi:MAG: hypothetical protein MPJ24_04785 [Pirellulaceae bacterium]|nr:hypothetical protein [Pirellulaceae bacterium]